MIHVVLDTNIFISAFLQGGKPRSLIDKIILEEMKGGISQDLLDEIMDTMKRGKFHFSGEYIHAAISHIRDYMQFVVPAETLNDASDPDDNRVLECAAAFKADFIITGDGHLLKLLHFRGMDILTPADFLEKYQVKD